jgi:hypothetical protein
MAEQEQAAHAAADERVGEFYRDHPDGSIRTFAVKLEGPEVVFEARVYRTPEEAAMGIYTSGWAREVEGKAAAGRAGHLERCESGAIARALANLGYTAAGRRAARAEPLRVARSRDEHDALLEFIKTVGPRVGEEAAIEIDGRPRNLRQYVRENWPALKEQPALAREVVEAVERATGTPFRREAA